MRATRNSVRLATLVAALTMVLPGCGRRDRPDLGRVRGVVVLDGEPLANATVVFEPIEGGRSSRGRTDSAGRYELIYLRDIEGAIVGPHRVRILTGDEEIAEERLPERYHIATTLNAEVAPGHNEHEFALSSTN